MTARPAEAWAAAVAAGAVCSRIPPEALCKASKPAGSIRIVSISDTHTKHDGLVLPEGDVLVHAGDFSFGGRRPEIDSFCAFLARQRRSFKQIIVIAGNHEISMDASCPKRRSKGDDDYSPLQVAKRIREHALLLEGHTVDIPLSLASLKHGQPSARCMRRAARVATTPPASRVAEGSAREQATAEPDTAEASSASSSSSASEPASSDSLKGWHVTNAGLAAPGVRVYEPQRGSPAAVLGTRDPDAPPPPTERPPPKPTDEPHLRVWGTPYQAEYGSWAFNLPRGSALAAVWAEVPDDTDLLLSHGPPLGHGDRCYHGARVGDVDLLHHVTQRIRPSACVFGHIHEDRGTTTDGTTLFINASSVDLRYRANNKPICFDFPIAEDALRGVDDSGDQCTESIPMR